MIRLRASFDAKAHTAGNALFAIQIADFAALFRSLAETPLLTKRHARALQG
jgi:hypothetical protein